MWNMQSQSRSEEHLLEACRRGELDQVRSMLDQGDSNIGNPPPLEKMMIAASEQDRSDIVKYCLERGAKATGFVIKRAALSKAWNTQRVLVTVGCIDVNFDIEGFGDLLILATKYNNLDAIRFFLEHGADPNLSLVQDSMKSIAVAAKYASVEAVSELIKHSARVEDSGAIILGAEKGKMDMVKLLLTHGADINEIGLKDEDERNDVDMGAPLHKAIDKHEIEMVKLLLEHGADVEKHDFLGRTPLQWANELGRKEESAILESHIAACTAEQNTS